MSARFRPIRGFTLIELLVSLAVMALLALLSWRGIDSMTRAQVSMRERMDQVLTLQIGLTQWSADLDAVMETAQVSGIDYDGRVLRLTRRDTSSEGSPLRVVGWARRVIEGPANGRGSWARWQSPPLHTRAELLDAWAQAELWGQNPGAAQKQREVAVVGLDQWQIFFFRHNAWSNPQSTASATGASNPQSAASATEASTAPAGAASIPSAQAAGSALAPLPDGIRLVLTLASGQALTGTLTKDWIRPVLGGGKS